MECVRVPIMPTCFMMGFSFLDTEEKRKKSEMREITKRKQRKVEREEDEEEEEEERRRRRRRRKREREREVTSEASATEVFDEAERARHLQLLTDRKRIQILRHFATIRELRLFSCGKIDSHFLSFPSLSLSPHPLSSSLSLPKQREHSRQRFGYFCHLSCRFLRPSQSGQGLHRSLLGCTTSESHRLSLQNTRKEGKN